MFTRKAVLVASSLIGAGLIVAAAGASQTLASDEAHATHAGSTAPPIPAADSPVSAVDARSLYDEVHAAATVLRGLPVSSAVGRPVSLEMVASLLRAVSFGAGPTAPAQWTLFLPTDEAFAPLAGAPLDALIHDPNALLDVLDRHLVVGALSLDDLRRVESVPTLGGQPLEVAVGETTRVKGATVLAEQRVGNGRIFIIDRLLQR